MMSERNQPQRLRDLLPGVGRGVGLNDASGMGSVWARWSDIVGEQIAEHAEPTSLRDGILRVRTESPSWATEIGYLAQDIVHRVNENIGRAVVSELKVWTGPGPIAGSKDRVAKRSPRVQDDETESSGVPDDPKAALAAARAAWEGRRRRGSKRPPRGANDPPPNV